METANHTTQPLSQGGRARIERLSAGMDEANLETQLSAKDRKELAAMRGMFWKAVDWLLEPTVPSTHLNWVALLSAGTMTLGGFIGDKLRGKQTSEPVTASTVEVPLTHLIAEPPPTFTVNAVTVPPKKVGPMPAHPKPSTSPSSTATTDPGNTWGDAIGDPSVGIGTGDGTGFGESRGKHGGTHRTRIPERPMIPPPAPQKSPKKK